MPPNIPADKDRPNLAPPPNPLPPPAAPEPPPPPRPLTNKEEVLIDLPFFS